MSAETKHTKEPVYEFEVDFGEGDHTVEFVTYDSYRDAQQRISSLEAQLADVMTDNTDLRHSLNKADRTLEEYKRMYDASEAQNKELREAGEQFRCSLVEGAFAADIPDEIWLPFIKSLRGGG